MVPASMENGFSSSTIQIEDGIDAFAVTVLKARSADRSVVFAAGRSGNPSRYLALLQSFASQRIDVIAPHFDMLASPSPTRAELLERSRRMTLVADRYCPPDLPVCGVGHSIGTVPLLILAGAEATTLGGDRVTVRADRPLERLVLFAPPTDFFRPPGSLTSVTTPIQAWAGGKDAITPPEQAYFLQETLQTQTAVDVHVVAEAGHFTFMNELPPNAIDTHPDRAAFLLALGHQVIAFIAG